MILWPIKTVLYRKSEPTTRWFQLEQFILELGEIEIVMFHLEQNKSVTVHLHRQLFQLLGIITLLNCILSSYDRLVKIEC